MGVSCSRCGLKDSESRENGDIGRQAKPINRNEKDNFKRRRPNVDTKRTTRVSVAGSEYSFVVSMNESSTGINIINCETQDRTSQNVERNIPNRDNGIESLQRSISNVSTERSTSLRVSVEGSEYSFDLPRYENSPGIVIINHKPPYRTSQNEEQKKQNRGGIFTCGHTTASFERYVQKKRNECPAGNFIDCRNVPMRNSVRELQELVKWSHSVCQIRFGNGTATGFRVGSKYIMTALHVVKEIIKTYSAYRREVQLEVNSEILALAHPNVFCWFDYFIENQFENLKKYFFKTTLHFYDEETDTAILELDKSRASLPLPLPFEEFDLPYVGDKFTFLGHEGSAKEYNTVDRVIDKDNEHTREDMVYVNEYNNQLTREPYECPPHSSLTNEHRIVFHCKIGKGASGSPGLSVQEEGRVVVVTMLLCGYPNWYYDQNVDRNLLKQWPKEYCIEQGADMISVGNKIYRENRSLYREIFRSHNIPVPNIY